MSLDRRYLPRESIRANNESIRGDIRLYNPCYESLVIPTSRNNKDTLSLDKKRRTRIGIYQCLNNSPAPAWSGSGKRNRGGEGRQGVSPARTVVLARQGETDPAIQRLIFLGIKL